MVGEVDPVAEEHSLAGQHLDTPFADFVHVDVRQDAVGEPNDAAHTLVLLVPWVAPDPAHDPLHISVVGHQARHAEALATTAQYLVVRVVDVDGADVADLSRYDHLLELPELG